MEAQNDSSNESFDDNDTEDDLDENANGGMCGKNNLEPKSETKNSVSVTKCTCT